MNLARGALICCVILLASLAQAAGRPNVLWICADDHAAYVCGAYGDKQVRTPRLDKLAAEGLRFDRAYCSAPVCTVSRQSFLTGRYPHSVGVTRLPTPLAESETTLAEMLAAAGYQTAAIGKMHFNSKLAHGFGYRLDMPDYKASGAAGRKPPGDVATLGPWRPFKDPASVWLNSACLSVAELDEEMPDTYFAMKAGEYLKAAGDKPFFLMVSFYTPHSPFHFPVEYRNRHKPAEFKAPDVAAADDWQIPECFRDLTTEQKQGIRAAYYTSVEFMDANVGRVLDALEASGHADDTLVIYTGDHGYMLGQHGRFEKHCSYEPAVRAPLLMRAPGRAPVGKATSALVEFVDIVPTVLELCDLPIPASVQGRPLTKLLAAIKAGETVSHRDCVFVVYPENAEALVRTDRWKLVYMTGGRERQDGYATGKPSPRRVVQLFDMQEDPDETTNIAGRPEHAQLVAQLTRRLAEHMRRTITAGSAAQNAGPQAASADLTTEAEVHAALARWLPPVEK